MTPEEEMQAIEFLQVEIVRIANYIYGASCGLTRGLGLEKGWGYYAPFPVPPGTLRWAVLTRIRDGEVLETVSAADHYQAHIQLFDLMKKKLAQRPSGDN